MSEQPPDGTGPLGDDATIAADSDLVASIRARARSLRARKGQRSEVAPIPAPTREPAAPASPPHALRTGRAEISRNQRAATRSVRAEAPATAKPDTTEGAAAAPVDLAAARPPIAGDRRAEVSEQWWDPDRPATTQPNRRAPARSNRVPLIALIVLSILLAILIAVAIAGLL